MIKKLKGKEVALVNSQQLYNSVFTPEQISYITKSVATAAKEVLGDRMVKVILYGSYARGDYHEWSDVDII